MLQRLEFRCIQTVMRGILAVLLGSIRCLILLVSPLLACPFLQAGQTKANQHCCPRPHSPAKSPVKSCPLASTLDSCPYFLTESKIGIAQAEQSSPFALTATTLTVPALASSYLAISKDFVANRANAYLRNRVLRI